MNQEKMGNRAINNMQKQRQNVLGESGLRQLNKSTQDNKSYKEIIETIREPVLALDLDLRVLYANRSFYKTFKVTSRETIGNLIYDLGNRQWDIPKLRTLLEEIIPKHNLSNGYQIEHEFPTIGKRIILLNARRITNSLENQQLILLTTEDVTDRIRIEQALQASNENRYHELFNHIGTCVAVYEAVENGRDFIFKDFNKAAEKIDRTPRKKVIGRKVTEVFPGIREMGLLRIFQRVWKTGKPEHQPISIYKDQRLVGWRENYVYKLPSGEIVAAYEDATKRKGMEKALRDSEAELQALFASMKDLVIVHDKEGRYLKIATTNSQLLLKPAKDRIGKTIHEVFPKEIADRFVGHIQTVLETQRTMPIEYSLEIKHKKVWFDTSVSPMNKDTVIWVARDITERKMLEEKSFFIGTHDQLTNLYNRTFYEEELVRLEKSRLFPVSIFMVDVDGLKTINDTQGHAVGDELLQRTAKILLESFRSEDMVARIGGDEFVAVLPKTNAEVAQLVLKRINHFLELNNKNKPNDLKISVGIATCDKQGLLSDTVKKADDLMYLDKRSKG